MPTCFDLRRPFLISCRMRVFPCDLVPSLAGACEKHQLPGVQAALHPPAGQQLCCCECAINGMLPMVLSARATATWQTFQVRALGFLGLQRPPWVLRRPLPLPPCLQGRQTLCVACPGLATVGLVCRDCLEISSIFLDTVKAVKQTRP
jgi:hypothetical protein